jgi:hypothetical protein
MRRSLAFASIALVAAILAFWGAMAERGSAEGERVGHSVVYGRVWGLPA